MNVRVHVKNELESRVVQERAFELGYSWAGESQKVENLEIPYLFLEELDMSITHADHDYHNEDFEEISFSTFVVRYIEELPEKWVIDIKEEYMDDLKVAIDKDTFVIISNLSSPYGYLHSHNNWQNGYWANIKHQEFTEITIEQFRHLVVGQSSSSIISGNPESNFVDLEQIVADFGKAGGDKSVTYTVKVSDNNKIFNQSSLLSLSFTDLISLRDYYINEINANKAHLGVLKTLSKRCPTDTNKNALKEAEVSNKALKDELEEVVEAIKVFINKLKK